MSDSVTVTDIPDCDLCGETTPAVYDSRLPAYGGAWAYVCQHHWETYGPGILGTGHGQKLERRQP